MTVAKVKEQDGMTLAKVKEQDGMMLAKVKEQDGTTLAKVKEQDDCSKQWRIYGWAQWGLGPTKSGGAPPFVGTSWATIQ